MKAKQDTVVKEREKRIAQRKAEKDQKKKEELEAKRAQKELQKKQIRALSFLGDEEEEESENEADEKEKGVSEHEDESSDEAEPGPSSPTIKKRKIGKNPDVDTSFLPDRDREEEENRLREILRQVTVLDNGIVWF